MTFTEFWLYVELLPFSQEVGATAWFPFVESIHVLSIVLMLGAILMLDLRVLCLAAMSYPVSTLARGLVPWSAIGFLLATVTGIVMFMTRAASHVENTAFQIKLLLLLLAGINIVYFHWSQRQLLRSVDVTSPVSNKARLCATVSLTAWVGVMLAGRWMGHLI
jgi:hypothetical protein